MEREKGKRGKRHPEKRKEREETSREKEREAGVTIFPLFLMPVVLTYICT